METCKALIFADCAFPLQVEASSPTEATYDPQALLAEKVTKIVQQPVQLSGDLMDWREHIHSDPEILSGKPVVKGTRLSVDFLLELFANGWSEEQVFEGYPNLTRDSLRAVFAFAAETTRDERTFELRR
jgi:uncharacterized protein (DUF433 family)